MIIDEEFKEFLDKMDSSTPKHIQNELIRCYLMEKEISKEELSIKSEGEVPKVFDDDSFVYDDDSFVYD